jgi:hypothetical protein
MKNLYFIVVFLSISIFASAQLQEVKTNILSFPQKGINKTQKTQNCGVDTVQYNIQKATGYSMISINNATSATGFAQYFDAPVPMTVYGFDFYAYATVANSLNVTCYLYNANPLDSMPFGTYIASTLVLIDSSFGGGNMDTLRKQAVFATPVTVTGPYVLVVENNTSNNIACVCNSYQAVPPDGGNEWLCGLNLGGTWTKSYNVNVGGYPFNADFLVSPYVSYDITANIDNPSTTCIPAGDSVLFSEVNPLLNNRMYNLAKFNDITWYSYAWDAGDGSGLQKGDSIYHIYANPGTYTLLHQDTIIGYSYFCSDTTSTKIYIAADTLEAGFSFSSGSHIVNFTDTSYTNAPAGVVSWLWDFGDGNTSIQQNPTHTYASSGNYTVCLTAQTNCMVDSQCSNVNVIYTSIEENEGLIFYPNPAKDIVHINFDERIEEAIVSINTITGQTVYQESFRNIKKASIDISSLTAAVYLFQINKGNKILRYSLIKE